MKRSSSFSSQQQNRRRSTVANVSLMKESSDNNNNNQSTLLRRRSSFNLNTNVNNGPPAVLVKAFFFVAQQHLSPARKPSVMTNKKNKSSNNNDKDEGSSMSKQQQTNRPHRAHSFVFPAFFSDDDDDDDTDEKDVHKDRKKDEQTVEKIESIEHLERLSSENGLPVTTVFRWQPPSTSSSQHHPQPTLFESAWSSLEDLFAPLHSNMATDDEIDRKDEFLRRLTWDELQIGKCIFTPQSIVDKQHREDHNNKLDVNNNSFNRRSSSIISNNNNNNNNNTKSPPEKEHFERTKNLLMNMVSSSLLAHGSIVVCSPLAQFSEETLTQPTRVKDFVDGSSCIAVFISEYSFRTKILEPFSASLLELKRLRNLALARVQAGDRKKRRQQQQQQQGGGSSLLIGRNNKDDDDDNENNNNQKEDEDLRDFTAHIFMSADVTPIDILQFSTDSVRVAESSAECQRVVPGLMKKDISRRRNENLKRFDQQLKIKEERDAAKGIVRTEMVLSQREEDAIREQQLSRGTTSLIGAHRYYEHVQRDFEEKLALTAATLPPKKYDNQGNDISLLIRKQQKEQQEQLRNNITTTTTTNNNNGGLNILMNKSSSNNGLGSYYNFSSSSSSFIDLDHFYSTDNRGVIGTYNNDDDGDYNNNNNANNGDNKAEAAFRSQEQKKKAASATVISSQLFGGSVAVQFSRHLSLDDHHARKFINDKHKEQQQQHLQLAKYKRDQQNEKNNKDNNDLVNNNNGGVLSRELTEEEKMDLKLKLNIEKLDRECHQDVESAVSEMKEQMASRLQRRRKLRENAAVEQGVADAVKGKERIRHRLAIERAAVFSMKELIEETGEDRIGRRDNDVRDRILSGGEHRKTMMKDIVSMTVVPVD